MARRGKIRKGESVVPAAPFSQWLRDQIAEYEKGAENDQERKAIGASQRLATEIGWGTGEHAARRLYRYKNQIRERIANRYTANETRWSETAEVWARSEVEDACHTFNPDLFYELYPELRCERDITLEPDAWCPFCEQLVTPIDGLCPWCVCDHGHLFREVGVTDDGFACLGCLKKERRERDKARKLVRDAERAAA